MLKQDFFRNAGALFAEHQIAVRFIGYLRIYLMGLGGGHIDFCTRVTLQKIRVIVIDSDV